jgi:aspartyl-tRNA synthetase
VSDRKWIPIAKIDASLLGQVILVRARLHNSRVKGNLAFLVLRE